MASAHWFIADTHWGHGNIIKYCRRDQFMSSEELAAVEALDATVQDEWRSQEMRKIRISEESVQRMTNSIVSAVNERVGSRDVLWHLGDIAYWRKENMADVRAMINCGTVNLVTGNHDGKPQNLRKLFQKVVSLIDTTLSGQNITMCHYPMVAWNNSFHGAWHFFGHVHGRYTPPPGILAIDVGVDANGFIPLSFDDAENLMQLRRIERQKIHHAQQDL